MIYAISAAALGVVTVVLPRLRARREERIPLTVQLLIEAALIGKWPAPIEKGISQ